ncbi:MAG: ATP-grasp domain-containing protein [Bryobacteraceae bacterium]
MNSRFAEPLVLPDPIKQPARWLDFLEEAGRALHCLPVVIAAGDPQLILLAESAPRLDSRYRLAVPPVELTTTLLDKRLQYRLLMDSGAALPATHWPSSEAEAMHAARAVGFPCIAKPAYSHLWVRSRSTKLEVVGSPEQMRTVFRKMAESNVGLIVQELIPGGDDSFFGFLSYWSSGGRLLAWCTKRKLRQYPPGFGNGSYQVSVDCPEIVETSIDLLRRLNYRGFASIEYKRDSRDGRMKLIEINPRTVSGLQMAVDAGVDLPWIAYCDLVGAELPRTAVSRAGVRFINESWEARRFWTSGQRSPWEWGRWLLSLAQARSFSVLSFRDPGPALSLVARALRRTGDVAPPANPDTFD